jgi:NitT/TauT family transport system permease protein
MSREGILRLAVIGGAVLALEAACRTGLIPATTVIPPSDMAISLVRILRGGDFDADILRSLAEVAASALLAIGLGFVIGLGVHAWRDLRGALEPLLASYYAVPTFMLYPVFIILFGVGSGAIIAISVLLAVVAMITATLNALDRLPRVLLRTARLFHMGPVAIAWRVVLPAAMPDLFVGVKLAVAYAFVGVIASEFILSGAGLGYAIAYAYNNFNNRTMYALMLLIVIIVTVVNGGLNAVNRRLQARLRR